MSDYTADPQICTHPEAERQNLHHNGLPVELCRACGCTRGRRVVIDLDAPGSPPGTGTWGEWMPGFFGWASAPLFASERS